MAGEATGASERELVLERELEAPRAALFRCWTEPDLMKRFFVPPPWSLASAEIDPRAGGRFNSVMADPEGNLHPSEGIYLEVVPDRKLVFTDAFTEGWIPSGKPFMVATVTFDDAGDGRTLYRAVARHWSDEACRQHEEMGFHEGWGQVATQLEALARSL